MLGNQPFDFKTTEKIVAAFGWIFSDIHVVRANGKTIKVPIEFSGKEKYYQRQISDPNAGDVATQRHIDQIWPRMAYNLKNFRYDPSRKLSTISYRAASSGQGWTASKQLNPVPMIFDFTLYLRTRTLEDGWAIIEQFIPFFTPDYTVPILDIPEMGIKTDIVFTLKSNTSRDEFEGNLLKNRELVWEFEFIAEGHMYPPIKTVPVITHTDTTLSIFNSEPSGQTEVREQIVPESTPIDQPVTVDKQVYDDWDMTNVESLDDPAM